MMKKLLLLLFCPILSFSCQKQNSENEQLVTRIKLEAERLHLTHGGKHQFSVSHSPEHLPAPDKYEWSSSNPKVLTVDNKGTATALTAGTATITVQTTDKRLSATCNVLVQPLRATSFTLNKKRATLFVGQTEKLTYELLPANCTDKSAKWSSRSELIATIDNTGTITGQQPGETTVFVSSNGLTDICYLTINPVEITGIAFDAKSLSVPHGSEFYLTTIISPSNATCKELIWSSSDSSIASVVTNNNNTQIGAITALKPGTTTIHASTANGLHTSSCEVTVTPIPVSYVTITPNYSTVAIGDHIFLNTQVFPSNASNKKLTLSTFDHNMATINIINDSFVSVNALRLGEVTIIVQSEDGDKRDLARVTVMPVDKMISINEARGDGLVVTPEGAKFNLKSTIVNPTNTFIHINNALLLDKNNNVLGLQVCNDAKIISGLSYTVKFRDLVFYDNSGTYGNNFFDEVSSYKVLFSFSVNGQLYQVERFFNANVW